MAVESAYILAAGFGTRLKPLTHHVPKPLVEVATQPLIEFALHYAHLAGAQKIAINTHYLHPAIENHIGPTSNGVPITYCFEPEVLGTGGGLRGMFEALSKPKGSALILNADALIDIDLRAMIKEHKRTKAVATLAVRDAPDKAKYGLLGTDEHRQIFGFAGRTKFKGPFVHERMFCGVHIAENPLFEKLHSGFCGVNQIGYPPLIDEGAKVCAFDIEAGYFCDVGTPDRLLEANLAFVEPKFRFLKVPACKKDARGLIHQEAQVDSRAKLSDCIVSKGARIDEGAVLKNCVVHANTHVKGDVDLCRAILTPNCVLHDL